MAITLNQLSSFLAVAREGSVSGAAEKLYVTQPSISAAVSALSREIGVDLTERVGRGIGLTAAGDAFRPYAADVLGLIEQGRQAAREAADFSMRSLRIVAVATAAEYVVPSLLRAFHRLHPEVNLALEVANRATVFERVLEHEVDVAIAGRPPDDERIAGLAFLKNDLALIVAPDDALAGRTIRPEELTERVWLMRELAGQYGNSCQFLAERPSPPVAHARLRRDWRGCGSACNVQRKSPSHELEPDRSPSHTARRLATEAVVCAALGDGAAAPGRRAVPRVRERSRGKEGIRRA